MDELSRLRTQLERARRANTLLEQMIEDRTRALYVANRDLESARDVAVEATRAKSEFLANMSHELRTPLNAILGYAEMLREELGQGAVSDDSAAQLAEDAGRIERSGRHLLELINSVLDLSKIEAGRLEVIREVVAVDDLLLDVLATARPLAARRGNVLAVEASDDLGRIETDGTRLKQVLLNLVGNACKFTENGRVQVDVDRFETDFVRFRVTDTGIGMSAATLAKLFQPFVQADASTTRAYGGTGLGLAISRRLCEALGGALTVVSEPGVGSTFTVVLPAERLPEDGPTVRGARALVLCIDDDRATLDLLRRHLQRDGWVVQTARSATEGLAVARQCMPALITLDLCLPRVDGWAALRAIQSEPSLADVPVVVVSILDQRTTALDAGAIDHVKKPFSREDLLRVVRAHARRDG